MMQHVLSDQISDFKRIYEENVELVSVERPRSEELEILADHLFAKREVVELDWRQKPKDKETPLKELQGAIQNHDNLASLAKEIIFVNEILDEILDCKEISVRVATISGLMCPKFHTDHVFCRMLVTVRGPSTEWIASEDVHQAALYDPEADAPPLKEGKEIRHLVSGGMSLLKGGNWQDGFRGVVHRSPHKEGLRLLLTFDPIFSS